MDASKAAALVNWIPDPSVMLDVTLSAGWILTFIVVGMSAAIKNRKVRAAVAGTSLGAFAVNAMALAFHQMKVLWLPIDTLRWMFIAHFVVVVGAFVASVVSLIYKREEL